MYVGQVVNMPKLNKFGVFVGYADKLNKNCWVFYTNEEGENDVYAHDLEDMSYIMTDDKDTISGTKIYYGPFRRKTLVGCLTNKYIEDNEGAFVKELNRLSKKRKQQTAEPAIQHD